jgi:hypothetical protein
MPMNLPQSTVANSDHRFRVLIAGRRMGKTWLAIRELARFARQPNRKVLYIAPSYRMAKQIVWADLKGRLTAVNWIKKVNESELTITLVNGSEIMLRSADNYDSIRGLGVDFVVFDEFANILAETWTEVVRPALSDRNGHALFIGTPKGVGNWAKDLFDRGSGDRDDWASWQFTTLDGGNVTAQEIESAKSDLDIRTFRQEYCASFETYANNIYYNFNRKNLVKEFTAGEKDVVHVGIDFNVSPLAAVCGRWNGSQLQVFDNIEIYGSNTQEMCDELKLRYPNNKIIAYPDASGGARSTKGTSDHKILQTAGFSVVAPRKNPPVRDRVNAVNAAFENANGETRLYISAKCKKLAECLEKQTYKGDTHQPDKTSGFDHMNDALGYMVHSLMPIKRPVEESSVPDYYGAI